MNKNLEQVLQEILESKDCNHLEELYQKNLSHAFTPTEKELFARLLLQACEMDLRGSDITAEKKKFIEKSIEIVRKLGVCQARLIYVQALFCLSYDQFDEAEKLFEQVYHIEPDFFDSLYSYAKLLMQRGIQAKDETKLLKADALFEQCQKMIELDPERTSIDATKLVHNGEFFWYRGILWFILARLSEEAYDLHKALQFYKTAHSQGITRREFFNDWGNALVEFAVLVSKGELLLDAIECYHKAIEGSENDRSHDVAIRHLNLACCYLYLFEQQFDDLFFQKANEYFQKASEFEPSISRIWVKWGYLALVSAKVYQNALFLEVSQERFSRAFSLGERDVVFFAYWAESLIFLATHKEQLAIFKQAERVLEQGFSIQNDCAELWAVSAMLSFRYGRYFQEEKYYLEAIEKAEHGIAITHKQALLWYVLACTKMSLGEMRDETDYFQEALLSFSWAAKGNLASYGFFWNDYGVACMQIAESTEREEYIQEAIEKFEKALKIGPRISDWLFNCACAYDFYGDLEDDEDSLFKAIDYLEEAKNHNPSQEIIHQLALSYAHLAESTQDKEMFIKAIDLFKALIQEDPENEHAWNDIGITYLNLFDLVHESHLIAERENYIIEAKKAFMQAQILGSAQAYYNLACASSLNEQVDDAVYFLEKALDACALPTYEDLMEDEWLDPIREHKHFQNFMSSLHQD